MNNVKQEGASFLSRDRDLYGLRQGPVQKDRGTRMESAFSQFTLVHCKDISFDPLFMTERQSQLQENN